MKEHLILIIVFLSINISNGRKLNKNYLYKGNNIISNDQSSINFQKNIILRKLQLQQLNTVKVQLDNLLIFYSSFDSSQDLNLQIFSSQINFGFLTHIIDIKQNINENLIQKQANEIKIKISNSQNLQNKIIRNLQYKHFMNIQQNKKSQSNISQNKLILIILFIPSIRQQTLIKNQQVEDFTINIVLTQKQFIFNKNSFEKPIQYLLKRNEKHIFKLNLNQIFQSTYNFQQFSQLIINQFTMNFYIVHLQGDYQYEVHLNLTIFNQNKTLFQNSSILSLKSQDSYYQINSNQLYQNIIEIIKSINLTDVDSKFIKLHSILYFVVKCQSKTCNLLTQIQKVSNVHQMIPGNPYIYNLNNFKIFAIQNPFDDDIQLDINKKNGFIQYKICSIKSEQIQKIHQNPCIKQLKNPTSTIKLFQVNENDDKIHSLGRHNQIKINPFHQAYCFKCIYFIALYTDYDKVQGMISFKNTQSSFLIPEASSITKVLERGSIDSYIIYGQESRLLLEVFSGNIQVYYQQIQINKHHNLDNQIQSNLQKIQCSLNLIKQGEKYYSIDIKDCLSLKNKQQKSQKQKKIHKIYIKTQKNYPSIFYSFIVVNNESRRIMLKDGIPFFHRQTNEISVFKYMTERLAASTFGTIMITSNQISDIKLEIFGYCLELNKTNNKIRLSNIQKDYKERMQTSQYFIQRIQNTKINLMANRIDVLIEPEVCKSYQIKIINNFSQQKTIITYELLVSFVDSMILPLNIEIPGILKYPEKIVQVYEIFLSEKTQLSILINFCRGSKSRMQIYQSKQSLFSLNSDRKIKFTSQSQLQEIIYFAHSGTFYITIELFGFSNILEYTILIRHHEKQQGFYYTDLSNQQKVLSYEVKQGNFFLTTYRIYFSPIFLKHWNLNFQRDIQNFQTNYFLLQSNSYPLLKRASSCKGQFFSDIINHHQHFKQIKLQNQKLIFHHPQKSNSNTFSNTQYYQRGYYTYEYQTSNPLSFFIIVPVISKVNNRTNQIQKQSIIIPYWQFDKKSRQPYQITQLYNGNLFSIFQHWFISFLIWIEQIVDIHNYQEIIGSFLLLILCLPGTCFFLVCTFKTKVFIQQNCNKIYLMFQKKSLKQNDLIIDIDSIVFETQRHIKQQIKLIQVQNLSDGYIEPGTEQIQSADIQNNFEQKIQNLMEQIPQNDSVSSISSLDSSQ